MRAHDRRSSRPLRRRAGPRRSFPAESGQRVEPGAYGSARTAGARSKIRRRNRPGVKAAIPANPPTRRICRLVAVAASSPSTGSADRPEETAATAAPSILARHRTGPAPAEFPRPRKPEPAVRQLPAQRQFPRRRSRFLRALAERRKGSAEIRRLRRFSSVFLVRRIRGCGCRATRKEKRHPRYRRVDDPRPNRKREPKEGFRLSVRGWYTRDFDRPGIPQSHHPRSESGC